MSKSPAYPNLEGLDRLALRSGVDIRPTLVRVLTDLYLQKPAHTPEEERHYTELALRLIDRVDVGTRKIVAAKLANYASAPAAVVRRLARDVLEVAQPILEHSPRLTGSELLAIIAELGPQYAAVIARRLQIARQAKAPAERASVAPASKAAAHLSHDSGSGSPLDADAPALSERPAAAATRLAGLDSDLRLGDLFLAAAPAERRLILCNLDGATDQPLSGSTAQAGDAVRRLETAALQRKPAEFMRALERALGISAQHAHRMVMVVAAKALGMAPDVVLRILLFLNPVIGQSVTRVFDLAKLYDAMTREAALRLVASLRGASASRRWASYRPVLAKDEPERGLANEAARRAAGRAGPDAQGQRPAAGASPSRNDKIEQM
ncbi:MAG: hypothetical protein E6G88_10595 [Alphaproteobacteria bacterium]|nr:MAG: hypothetical protein E6G88_10595 [Alphaproteobacteria bacterium]